MKPKLIIIDGPMGSGKTMLSKELHKKMKRTALISLDHIKLLLSDYKKGSPEDFQLAADIGKIMTTGYLKRGISVIVEKAFTKEIYLKFFLRGLNKYSKTYIYQLHAHLDIRKERIKKRSATRPGAGRPTPKRIKTNTKNFEEFRYEGAKEFDSSKLPTRQIANKILKEII